jgi:hypothetical protein
MEKKFITYLEFSYFRDLFRTFFKMMQTDGALYSWKTDHDLLMNGREDGKADFRLREEFKPGLLSGVKMEWRELIKKDLTNE